MILQTRHVWSQVMPTTCVPWSINLEMGNGLFGKPRETINESVIFHISQDPQGQCKNEQLFININRPCFFKGNPGETDGLQGKPLENSWLSTVKHRRMMCSAENFRLFADVAWSSQRSPWKKVSTSEDYDHGRQSWLVMVGSFCLMIMIIYDSC